MLKIIEFDPDKGKLYATFESKGLVIASYTIRLHAVKIDNEKIVQEEFGNNLQPHDDTFWLRNKSNETEPVVNNDGRWVEMIVNVNTDKKEQPYNLALLITQGDAQTLLGGSYYEGSISDTDGGQMKTLGVILKAKN